MMFCVNSRRLTRVTCWMGDASLLIATAAAGTAAAAGQLHRWNDNRVELVHVDNGQSGVGGGLATRHRLLKETTITTTRLSNESHSQGLKRLLGWFPLFLKWTHETQFWRGPTLGSASAGTLCKVLVLAEGENRLILSSCLTLRAKQGKMYNRLVV